MRNACNNFRPAPLTRREMLLEAATGFGAVAMTALTAEYTPSSLPFWLARQDAAGRLRNAVRELPLLIMRGLASEDYSESQMCDEIRLFHAARLQVHLRQYTCGNDLIEPMLRDLDSWLMEQVTGAPVLAESDAAPA